MRRVFRLLLPLLVAFLSSGSVGFAQQQAEDAAHSIASGHVRVRQLCCGS